MKIRLFKSAPDGCSWVETESFDGGKVMPSQVISRKGKLYWWNSALNETTEYFMEGFTYCEADGPTTHY